MRPISVNADAQDRQTSPFAYVISIPFTWTSEIKKSALVIKYIMVEKQSPWLVWLFGLYENSENIWGHFGNLF